jgi:rhodanese-related sulfurtransferase
LAEGASLPEKSFAEIEVEALSNLLKTKDEFVLLDVREPLELEQVRIEDARMTPAPMSGLSKRGTDALPAAAQSRSASIYVLCHHGTRSLQVARWLAGQGWSNVTNVRGGIDAYARRVDASVGLY